MVSNPFYSPSSNTAQPQTVDMILRSLGAATSVSNTVPVRKGYVPPSNRGVGIDRTDVTTFPSAVEALASAEPGQTFYFPPNIYKNPLGVGNGLTVPCDNVTLEFAPGAEIQVATWGQPGIDCLDRSRITTKGGIVRWVGTRVPGGGVSYRGSIQTSNTAGVYINKDYNTIQGLRTIGMPVLVYLSSWDGVTSRDRKGLGNTVSDFECEIMDFGVLWSGQNKLKVLNGYGHEDFDDSLGVNPTHVIYCAGNSDFRSSDIIVDNLNAENILTGHAYQIKHCDQMKVTNLQARHCVGLINTVSCTDGNISDISIYDCVTTPIVPTGALICQSDIIMPLRMKFDKVAIVMDLNGTTQRALHFIGQDCDFTDLSIVANRNAVGGDIAEIRMLGTDNRVMNPRIKNIGSIAVPAFQIGDTTNASTGFSLRNPKVSGCSRLANFYDTGGGIVEYAAEELSLTTGTVVGTGGGAPVYRVISK